MSVPQTPHPPRRRKESDRKGSNSPFLRLIAAVLLFGLCFVAKVHFPRQTQGARERLTQLIGSQTDFQETFSRLGEELERREEVVHALGDFCVSVFGPEGMRVDAGEEGSAPPNGAESAPEGEETGSASGAESAAPEGDK